jgi:deoxyribodipyrimidine photolyase-related protein
MLNLGLLTPQQVLNRTLEAADASEIPLNSLEGFLRQIIGWREFMAAMYKRHGVTMRNSNFWNFEDRPYSRCFLSREQQEYLRLMMQLNAPLDTGYCHHIERLMLARKHDASLRLSPNPYLYLVYGTFRRCLRLGHGSLMFME